MWELHPTTVLLTYCQTFILYECLYVVCVLVSIVVVAAVFMYHFYVA